ncbi:hypothetical protein [Neptunomonas antarctica]|uniref:hypothetical protein n=1 Tax=Neptunomonas antarctica TaxID=619304 RepID=UPI0006C7A4BB|nr:hypothetical protein [Neptunomonas antarctica]
MKIYTENTRRFNKEYLFGFKQPQKVVEELCQAALTRPGKAELALDSSAKVDLTVLLQTDAL